MASPWFTFAKHSANLRFQGNRYKEQQWFERVAWLLWFNKD